jgi:plastocyanin domain-containing protein
MSKRSANYLILSLFLSAILFVHDASALNDVYNAFPDKDGVQKVAITGGDYYFKPGHIIVRKNIPVEFRVKKEKGIIPHNIIMKEPAAGIDFKESISREPLVIRFIPLKTGKFSFYCDKRLLFFKNHREKGMEGILEVIE